MSRYVYLLVLFIASFLLWLAYLETRLPHGVEAKGPNDSFLPWVTLAGSIISLCTGLVGLGSEIIKLKARRRADTYDD